MYVNNNTFLEFLKIRKSEIETVGVPSKLTEKTLGEFIMKIAYNLANRYNFINYTYKDDMIGDAIETCYRYIDRFNVDEYDRPFAYFTQVCYYSFARRINKEKIQHEIKGKLLLSMEGTSDSFDIQEHDTNNVFKNEAVLSLMKLEREMAD
jgi:hypothetical protein